MQGLALRVLYLACTIPFTIALQVNEAVLRDLSVKYTKRTESGIHLPLIRSETNLIEKRGLTSATGLGNYIDVTYNVLISIGEVTTPVVLDTGSSDLWVISDRCTGCSTSGDVPQYPQDTFRSTGLEALLLYGDSQTGTYALGLIGQDTVDLAGLTLPGQYFAAINSTNTTITSTGSAGIFGLGFPINSGIWNAVFTHQAMDGPPSTVDEDTLRFRSDEHHHHRRSSPKFPDLSFANHGYGSRFPDLDFLKGPHSHSPRLFSPRQADEVSGSMLTSVILTTFPTLGPLLPRLATTDNLVEPIFSITLSRNTIEIGGNVGMLSIGELPSGVHNESLTWVPLRAYSPAEGGLHPPNGSPNEVYPITWEIPIDDVYLNGERLPRSNLTSSDIALSALVDTGNSLIRGPSDVVNEILRRLGGSTFLCGAGHILSFSIGGKLFPVDPRDLIRQAFLDNITNCVSTLSTTDPPVEQGRGYRYSWSLGDPFLKSVLSAYYYGNITHPSQDPPRMGFVSTVPADAADQLLSAIDAANAAGGNFPAEIDWAPTGPPRIASTGLSGVPGASSIRPTPSSSTKENAPLIRTFLSSLLLSIALFIQ